MKLCAIETKELEDKLLTRFADNQNDELLEDLSDYVINSQKEIDRLNTIIFNQNKRNSHQRIANEKLQAKYDLVHSIIKEVREYINWRLEEHQDMYKYQMEECLEILDKEKE